MRATFLVLAAVVAGRAALVWTSEVFAHRRLRPGEVAAAPTAAGACRPAGTPAGRSRQSQPGRVGDTRHPRHDALDGYFARYLPALLGAAIVPLTVVAGDPQPGRPVAGSIILLDAAAHPPVRSGSRRAQPLNGGRAAKKAGATLSTLGGHFLDVVEGLPDPAGLPSSHRTGGGDPPGVGGQPPGDLVDPAAGVPVLGCARVRRDDLGCGGCRRHRVATVWPAASTCIPAWWCSFWRRRPTGRCARWAPSSMPARTAWPPPSRSLPCSRRRRPTPGRADGEVGATVAVDPSGRSGLGDLRPVETGAAGARPDDPRRGVRRGHRPERLRQVDAAQRAARLRPALLRASLVEGPHGTADLADLDPDDWLDSFLGCRSSPGWPPRASATTSRLAFTGGRRRRGRRARRACRAVRRRLPRVRGPCSSARSRPVRRPTTTHCPARAFLREAPLVLLDEPSDLDPASEAAVAERCSASAAGRTVIAVAHRPALLAGADRIGWLGSTGTSVPVLASAEAACVSAETVAEVPPAAGRRPPGARPHRLGRAHRCGALVAERRPGRGRGLVDRARLAAPPGTDVVDRHRRGPGTSA